MRRIGRIAARTASVVALAALAYGCGFGADTTLNRARQALAAGGQAPNVLNAANEVAVAGFLNGQTGFLNISAIVEETLSHIPQSTPATLEDVMAIDTMARRIAGEYLQKRADSRGVSA